MPKAGQSVWGYAVRDPFPSEDDYFRKNVGVAGMAAEDGRIILNPHNTLSDGEREAVARNEAARLYMREHNVTPDFDVTPEQSAPFKGTAYEKDAPAMRSTILARALSGDPSAGSLTPQQQQWLTWLRPKLEGRR